MPDTPILKVENAEELLQLLNGFLPAVRSKAVVDGMIAGANAINQRAQAALYAGKKESSTTGYSYYATAFKQEKLKGKTPDELGVRTGVWSRENGYKLRWLEWGTNTRTTFQRKNPLTNTLTPKMNRGKITGTNFFFSAVKGQQTEIFNIVSEAIIKSLEDLTRSKSA